MQNNKMHKTNKRGTSKHQLLIWEKLNIKEKLL